MMIRQMVICTIDHSDGGLHNDHTLIFKFYIWEHLKLKSKLKLELKLSNMYAYINLLHYIRSNRMRNLHIHIRSETCLYGALLYLSNSMVHNNHA